MKKIMFMLIVLIVVMMAWGSVIVVYASSSHAARIMPTPEPATPTPTQSAQQTIADNAATVEPQVKNSVISQGDSNLPEVALTFDDGPSAAYTPQILNILQQNGVHATFFCVGEQVRYYPDLAQQEYSAGNVVGNHSWSHPDLTRLSSTKVQIQLSDTSAIIKQATGVQPTLFRPPYGAINEGVKSQAADQSLTPVLWSIDTEDWQRPGSSAIVKTASSAGNGDIILLHDGGGDRSQTVAALPLIIKHLQQRGLQLVTVQQLLHDMKTAATTSTSSATAMIASPGGTQMDRHVESRQDRERRV